MQESKPFKADLPMECRDGRETACLREKRETMGDLGCKSFCVDGKVQSLGPPGTPMLDTKQGLIHPRQKFIWIRIFFINSLLATRSKRGAKFGQRSWPAVVMILENTEIYKDVKGQSKAFVNEFLAVLGVFFHAPNTNLGQRLQMLKHHVCLERQRSSSVGG